MASTNLFHDKEYTTQLRRCVILGTPSESFWLQTIIEKYFSATFIIQAYHEIACLPPTDKTLLLLATDTFPGGLSQELITTVKKDLTPMLTVCLLEKIDPETEISLRASGLTFLGSYSFFMKNVEGIVGEFSMQMTGIHEVIVGNKYILKANESDPL